MSAFERIIPALIEHAQRIAAARLTSRAKTPERRWRNSALLWPHFAKD